MVYKNLPINVQKEIIKLLDQNNFSSAVEIYKEYQHVRCI